MAKSSRGMPGLHNRRSRMKRWDSRGLRPDGHGWYSASLLRGKIVEIDLVETPERLRMLDLSILND